MAISPPGIAKSIETASPKEEGIIERDETK
jgi:hypothetical protein